MTLPVFPTLRIHPDKLEAMGAFAEAQAAWLSPQPDLVRQLDAALEANNVGVVAHFYMDPQLQGVLSACQWPHIHISDSLVMADRAVAMAEAGVKDVIVLGVDFMSENVRAMLDAAGHEGVGVYRATAEAIGCSLAESAEARAYGAYLTQAAAAGPALHVVYINTSLLTKARAHHLVPTLTCTSSNVVQTILQAFAQIPELTVFFGPDTYMGGNLQAMFRRYAQLSDDEIRALHPAHDRASMAKVAAGLRIFNQGTCVVHHMFGADVVGLVREHYEDAHITAHLEVPGEMFALAAERVSEGTGVVGSTSNILSFMLDQVRRAGSGAAPRFVLGTEAGMITPIVRQVQELLRQGSQAEFVDVVFPVSSQAVAMTGQEDLPIVPGVAGGEGCSTAGGCATCPFMKMNSLRNMRAVLGRIERGERDALQPFTPRVYSERVAGRSVAEVGSEPILHMRAFSQTGALPDALVSDVLARA